jgi:hypothetical protein
VCPEAEAAEWWTAARRRSDVPAAIDTLLHGRRRVEVTADEALDALAWAARVDGWDRAEPKPVFIHQPDTAAA